ncbi:MAG: PASTA domain-containing protein [bacterium]
MDLLRGLFKIVVSPLAALSLLFLLFNYLIMPAITRHGSEFPLPSIVGMTQADAEELFAELDLRLEITGREYSPDKPEGVVLTQMPQAGLMVKGGRSIKVIISAGVQVAEVPDIFGLPLRQAELTLQKEGFLIGDLYWADADTLPQDVAVETIPAAGTLLPLGSRVALAVNQGSRTGWVFMPTLVGQPLDRVRALLDSLQLAVGEIVEVKDTSLLPNTVIEQLPPRNVQVRVGDSVWVKVSATD